MAEQTPGQQELVAPTVTLPALVQALPMGHRAQKGHSFALSLTQSPQLAVLQGELSAHVWYCPFTQPLWGLNKEAEEQLPMPEKCFTGQTGPGAVSELTALRICWLNAA